jgi:glycosyltransferase involved in cell wall biosynthesis
VWNNSIKRLADHLLVHSHGYRSRLVAQGVSSERVTHTPLVHLFVSYEAEEMIQQQLNAQPSIASADSTPYALFFARLEAYKGIDVLIDAMRMIEATSPMRAIIAGKGDRFTPADLPANVEVRNRLIDDREALELFSRSSVVVLPYTDATQSAVIAAAYAFGKPVIVTRTGALPEYVMDGRTGWIIEPRNARELADRLRAAANDDARLAQMGAAGRGWYLAQRMIERRTLRRMYEQVDFSRQTLAHGKTQQTPGGRYVDY